MFIDMSKGRQLHQLIQLTKDFDLDHKLKEMIICLKETNAHIKHSATKSSITRLAKRLLQIQQSTSTKLQ